jgi:response regulator RpfG family c-di-GMP phosphodiesterase
MNKEEKKLQVFIKEDYSDVKNLLTGLSQLFEIRSLDDDKQNSELTLNQICNMDILIIAVKGDYLNQVNEIEKMKSYNPGLKTILYTSEKNWKYRSYYISKGIDFFLIKETESNLLQQILKQIYSRKTRTS